MGRPSDFTEEITAKICERIANGESLRRICLDDGMPVMSTVFQWLTRHEMFKEQYAHAREAQADTLADEIVDIADDGSRDYKVDEDGRQLVDHDHITRSRLRVDARKWIASKLKPKKYGDKVENTLSGPNGQAISHNHTVEFIGARPATSET